MADGSHANPTTVVSAAMLSVKMRASHYFLVFSQVSALMGAQLSTKGAFNTAILQVIGGTTKDIGD